MQVSREVAEIINSVLGLAKNRHYEYVTPELVLYVICGNKIFGEAFEECGGSVKELSEQLEGYINEYMDSVEGDITPELSAGTGSMLSFAWSSAQSSGNAAVGLTHIIHALYELEESYAVYYMQLQGIEHAELLQQMTILYEEMSAGRQLKKRKQNHEMDTGVDEVQYHDDGAEETASSDRLWRQFAVCLNDTLEGVNPLIGREEEIGRAHV